MHMEEATLERCAHYTWSVLSHSEFPLLRGCGHFIDLCALRLVLKPTRPSVTGVRSTEILSTAAGLEVEAERKLKIQPFFVGKQKNIQKHRETRTQMIAFPTSPIFQPIPSTLSLLMFLSLKAPLFLVPISNANCVTHYNSTSGLPGTPGLVWHQQLKLTSAVCAVIPIRHQVETRADRGSRW